MEIQRPPACPHLPAAPAAMSYRQLREGRARSAQDLHDAALSYAQYLWRGGLPARAILALCRAVYLDPRGLAPATVQPYPAYVWLLANYRGGGFLGNPRISFQHQGGRIPVGQPLKRARAWAMWHLTVALRPDLPADPDVSEIPPAADALADQLDRDGLLGEGACFLEALAQARALQGAGAVADGASAGGSPAGACR